MIFRDLCKERITPLQSLQLLRGVISQDYFKAYQLSKGFIKLAMVNTSFTGVNSYNGRSWKVEDCLPVIDNLIGYAREGMPQGSLDQLSFRMELHLPEKKKAEYGFPQSIIDKLNMSLAVFTYLPFSRRLAQRAKLSQERANSADLADSPLGLSKIPSDLYHQVRIGASIDNFSSERRLFWQDCVYQEQDEQFKDTIKRMRGNQGYFRVLYEQALKGRKGLQEQRKNWKQIVEDARNPYQNWTQDAERNLRNAFFKALGEISPPKYSFSYVRTGR